MFEAKVIKHSINKDGIAIATVVATYPRFIHAELLTHRDRARNSASSRAIPWKKYAQPIPGKTYPMWAYNESKFVLTENCMMGKVLYDPVIPIHFGKEQKGMQSVDEELSPQDQVKAIDIILDMRDYCVAGADKLAQLGLHKSLCNRYVEPWMWITTIITSTKWRNFFKLRCHSAAERHFQKIAGLIKDSLEASIPVEREYHTPFILPDEETLDVETKMKISSARCARISYLTHDGKRSIEEDLGLFNKLAGAEPEHASPLEHAAKAGDRNTKSGPYHGWIQFRKMYLNDVNE